MLTRKDFVRHAEVLKELDDGPVKDAKVKEAMMIFKESNPLFDEQRFLDAVKKK